MKIRISEIIKLEKRRKKINSFKFDELIFIDDNERPILIDAKIMEEWKFIGLNNADFITTEFYKNGFIKDAKTD